MHDDLVALIRVEGEGRGVLRAHLDVPELFSLVAERDRGTVEDDKLVHRRVASHPEKCAGVHGHPPGVVEVARHEQLRVLVHVDVVLPGIDAPAGAAGGTAGGRLAHERARLVVAVAAAAHPTTSFVQKPISRFPKFSRLQSVPWAL